MNEEEIFVVNAALVIGHLVNIRQLDGVFRAGLFTKTAEAAAKDVDFEFNGILFFVGALARFNVTAERREDRVGVWVKRPDKPPGIDGSVAEDKIAAIGIRVRRWVTFHGISLNVEPDLSHFSGIVPCGVAERHFGVTSLVDLGLPVTMADADAALKAAFLEIFGEIA